ncbi:hypothetical protein NQZ68_018401 [Dissostichus eleginoides]|nr:hypothetical protein NQZ68_018401 [Dissostichus eleginoides]
MPFITTDDMVPGIYQLYSQETQSTPSSTNEKSWKTPAIVSKECVTPRSYLINTQGGAVLRRNRLHLRAEPTSRPAQHIPLTPAESAVAISQPVSANTPETVTLKPSEVATHTQTPGRVQTRSGRVSKPATRMLL